MSEAIGHIPPQQSSDAEKRPISQGAKLAGAIVVVVAGVGIILGIRGRMQAESNVKAHTEQSSVLAVNVMKPKPSTETAEITLPGNTQAFNDTAIYARTNGYLKRWYVDIGTHVKRGQLLAEIDSPEVDRQLEQARADLKNAQANEKLAGITSTRWQNLLQKNAVSKQETDQAVSDLSSRQATVDSMAANVHRFEQLQSFEKVLAPFDGVITARNTDIGELINAGATGLPQELFHIAAVYKLRVYVAVPEIDSAAVQTGAKAYLTLDEFPSERFEGKIVRDSNAIDPTSRTLNVEVDVENLHDRIRPGAYVVVHFAMPNRGPASEKQSFILPSNTLLFRAEGLRVGVVRNGKAQLVPVTIRRDFGATVEVISGPTSSDQIILSPSDSLTSGTPVRISTGEKQ